MLFDAPSRALAWVKSTGEAVLFPDGHEWYILMKGDDYKEMLLRAGRETTASQESSTDKANREIAQIIHVSADQNHSIDNVFTYDTLENTVSKEE